jgi:hypothetical protein
VRHVSQLVLIIVMVKHFAIFFYCENPGQASSSPVRAYNGLKKRRIQRICSLPTIHLKFLIGFITAIVVSAIRSEVTKLHMVCDIVIYRKK